MKQQWKKQPKHAIIDLFWLFSFKATNKATDKLIQKKQCLRTIQGKNIPSYKYADTSIPNQGKNIDSNNLSSLSTLGVISFYRKHVIHVNMSTLGLA